MRVQWETEKNAIAHIKELQQQIEDTKHLIEDAERNYDLEKLAQLKYGVLPSCKMLMKLNGMDYGACREPFMPLDDAAIEDLKTVTIAD